MNNWLTTQHSEATLRELPTEFLMVRACERLVVKCTHAVKTPVSPLAGCDWWLPLLPEL